MSAYGYTRSKSTNAQESGLSPVSPELPDLPLRNVNNFTFNGVFKNVESVTSFLDCLGSHFTWLQNIFTNFPALLNFVSKLKCVTGLCPKDLEDYGCTCRYEMEGLPVDKIDSCCFQHRKCYEEALELDCTWDPTRITADVSCLSKNLTCETGDACEKVLCACDKAAIECLVNLQINSSMKGMDITFCESLVTELLPTRRSRQFILNLCCLFSVCDRYYFNQLKEDGNVKAELPLLGEMLFCLTGRCPEEFESYGCYCGQEGKGNPADILDSCCFSHHCCIEHLKKLGCKSDRNVRSEVLCMDNKPTCIGWGICDKLLCACDKAAAECMASAPFNQTMRTLRRDQCRDVPVVCRNGDVGDTPDRAIAGQSDSSSSEESSEEHSPMRDIVRAGPSVPQGRRPRSLFSEE
uniref:HHLA1 neighbor of OC90 n=1 Tax=Leptobrachium leishanense TaxID=445787 RepID=A0A8C5MVD8_9ANUR